MQLHPFLTFHGQCREAMHFYKSCFGGELELRFMAQSRCGLPSGMASLVLEASLVAGDFRLYASDLGPASGKGNGRVSLLVDPESDDMGGIFDKLGSGGNIGNGLASGNRMASLTDRYGVEWIFVCR